MRRVLSSRTFRSGRVAKMTYSETDEPDGDATQHTLITLCTQHSRSHTAPWHCPQTPVSRVIMFITEGLTVQLLYIVYLSRVVCGLS